MSHLSSDYPNCKDCMHFMNIMCMTTDLRDSLVYISIHTVMHEAFQVNWFSFFPLKGTN